MGKSMGSMDLGTELEMRNQDPEFCRRLGILQTACMLPCRLPIEDVRALILPGLLLQWVKGPGYNAP